VKHEAKEAYQYHRKNNCHVSCVSGAEALSGTLHKRHSACKKQGSEEPLKNAASVSQMTA
jgi:hypothetical protein